MYTDNPKLMNSQWKVEKQNIYSLFYC